MDKKKTQPCECAALSGGKGDRIARRLTTLAVLAVLVIGAILADGIAMRYFNQSENTVIIRVQPGDSQQHPGGVLQQNTPETQSADEAAPSDAAPPDALQPEITTAPESDAPTYGSAALSLKQIYQQSIPSVVTITAAGSYATAVGTGIVLSDDGYLLTNNHVIEGADAITVLFSDDTTMTADVVGTDAMTDVAVLWVDAQNLTPADFCQTDSLQVGDQVVAIGNPLGAELRGTMTQGIVSAINRDIEIEGRSVPVIQTDAALNEGNSGGPLINLYGQVVGMNTMKISTYNSDGVEGIGFAVPVSVIQPVVVEIMDKGYVSGRPALGLTLSALSMAARVYYHLPDGLYVSAISEGSDAGAQGLVVGDIIISVNASGVSTVPAVNAIVNGFQVGDAVTLTVYRGGKLYNFTVTLGDAANF
ncbi:MAG: trypsin-like peptidase domain-containing protein [Oscillospiraceae bacterium]|nr:trypsin-like peptidase domain-containing protein [Oscillospiraceae bacterium]